VRNRDFLPLIDPIPVLAGYEKLRVAEKMSRGEVYDGKKALSARE
jgi:hypothetical protein